MIKQKTGVTHMDLPKRKSPRLPGFDYATPGEYFVTICTEHRVKILGRIVDGVMHLSPAGRICRDELANLPHPIPAAVIMPNHVHLILALRSPDESITKILGAWKSVTTRRINLMDGTPGRRIWQRSFYDHGIRTDDERLQTMRYIEENPQKWTLDRLYID